VKSPGTKSASRGRSKQRKGKKAKDDDDEGTHIFFWLTVSGLLACLQSALSSDSWAFIRAN